MTPLEHIMGLMDPSYSEPVRRSFAQSILDKHAHELAERQRQYVRQQAADPHHYGSAHWATKGVDEAADLINPKAQHASKEQP